MKKKSTAPTATRAQNRRTRRAFPSIAAHEIAAIASVAPTTTHEQRAAFAKAIRAYISQHGYLPDAHGSYHDLIATVAEILSPTQIADGDREVAKIDAFIEQHAAPKNVPALQDAMWDRCTPNVSAALHIGIALGVALIYNGGVPR